MFNIEAIRATIVLCSNINDLVYGNLEKRFKDIYDYRKEQYQQADKQQRKILDEKYNTNQTEDVAPHIEFIRWYMKNKMTGFEVFASIARPYPVSRFNLYLFMDKIQRLMKDHISEIEKIKNSVMSINSDDLEKIDRCFDNLSSYVRLATAILLFVSENSNDSKKNFNELNKDILTVTNKSELVFHGCRGYFNTSSFSDKICHLLKHKDIGIDTLPQKLQQAKLELRRYVIKKEDTISTRIKLEIISNKDTSKELQKETIALKSNLKSERDINNTLRSKLNRTEQQLEAERKSKASIPSSPAFDHPSSPGLFRVRNLAIEKASLEKKRILNRRVK